MDVSPLAPFTNVACPKCGENTRVKRQFGPYTLVRRHAVGGMSMVFAAHDPTLDREVALKILSEDFSADERRIAAFEEEARITASFSHPNVVRVFTTGRAFGRFYIAMEMVPGGHFEHRIRECGKVPELEMLPLAIEVAQGLKAAHAAGLIHRDVKPGNILLDAEGHAKLVDFGLALVTQGGKATASELWATPYYVPPETVEGGEEDFRSDIYAFGSTLYHALSGKPPCGEESMATDVLREAKKKILPLSAADPSLSVDTCRVIERAMAYQPADRFASYDEMIAGLATALGHVKSGHAQAAGSASQRQNGRKQRKRLMLAAAGVGIVVISGLALWLANRPQPVLETLDPPVVQMPPADGAADDSAEIARRYREARAAVETANFELAQREFKTLHLHPQVQEPTRTWVGVEAVLAAYLDGRPADARNQAREIVEHVRSLPDSHPLGGDEWTALLGGLSGFPPLAAPKQESPVATVIAAMLAGIKNWEQGMLDEGTACFSAAMAAELPPDERWAAVYQKIATAHLEDHRILSGPLFAVEPSDAAACEKAISELDKTLALLKTRGRSRFNLRAWQVDLKRRAKHFEALKATKPAPAAPPETTIPPLAEVLARLAEISRDWRFSEATSYLKALPGDPQGASRASLLAIAEATTIFLSDIGEDLKKEPFSGELPLKNGAMATRIAVGSDGAITATLADGGDRPCAWSDFSPDALIAIHRVLVKNPSNEIERLRRHECAIAFDWLAGNRERALAAAANLSQSSPAFKERWEMIAGGLPE
jgi:hypothetical protein